MRRTSLCLGLAVALAGVLTVATPAGAAVTCDYDGAAETLTVTADEDDDLSLLTVEAGELVVVDIATGAVSCDTGDGTPTVNNTGVMNLVNGADDTTWIVGDPEALDPPGADEVETIAALGGGSDAFAVLDNGSDNDFWVLGANGINWNGDGDVDASFLPIGAVEGLGFLGGDGNDALTARGADGTGTPFAGPGTFIGEGSDDNDVVEGGDAGDQLSAGEGVDDLRGFGGPDVLTSDAGTNQLQGGDGDDRASYLSSSAGVSVDLGITGPQDTGLGTDTLSGIEGLEGSNQADALIGNGDANALLGQDGDDTLDGRGGNDSMQGGADTDTATYESAPAGVNVNLDTDSVTGGAGDDTLDNNIEDLIGSPFADTLVGDAANNTITGLGGNDTVSAMGGADAVRVRDGGPDTASCGAEIDTAVADRASVDSVSPDCETVDFLSEDAGDGGGEPSNEFSFGKAKKNKKKGTAKLSVNVPGAGELELAKTKRVKLDEERADAEGSEKLLVKAKGKARKKLNEKGKAKVNAEVTYTPTGGEPNTQSKRVKLARRG